MDFLSDWNEFTYKLKGLIYLQERKTNDEGRRVHRVHCHVVYRTVGYNWSYRYFTCRTMELVTSYGGDLLVRAHARWHTTEAKCIFGLPFYTLSWFKLIFDVTEMLYNTTWWRHALTLWRHHIWRCLWCLLSNCLQLEWNMYYVWQKTTQNYVKYWPDSFREKS